VPGRSSVYRALVRNGRIDPARRRRRRSDYKRWERGRPMELWQMDVVGGVHLADGAEVKVVTGIDDNSRFVVCARVVARATARASDLLDRYFLDGLVRAAGAIGGALGSLTKGFDERGINAGVDDATDVARGFGRVIARRHSGRVQTYLGAIAVGMLALLILYAWLT